MSPIIGVKILRFPIYEGVLGVGDPYYNSAVLFQVAPLIDSFGGCLGLGRNHPHPTSLHVLFKLRRIMGFGL